jgi:hypothetical protein
MMTYNTPAIVRHSYQNVIRYGLLAILLTFFQLPAANAQNGCTPPSGTKVSTILSSKITVNWDAANIANGNRIQLAWAEHPTSNYVYKVFESGESGEITGLKPATRYIVRITKLCGTESQSNVLGLGTIRTLSLAEEQAICDPELENDLCKALQGIATGERGAYFIDIKLPKLPALALAQYPDHQVIIRYRRLENGSPASNWESVSTPFANLNGPIRLNGLMANTLYQLEVVWEMRDANGQLVKTCTIPLNDTPTMGTNFVGPVFTVRLQPITMDCSTPRPVEMPFPIVSGGCTVPRVTFTDQALGSGCNQQILRTWLAVDDCGRSSTINQMISFVDHQAPTFVDVPPNNATIECTDNILEEFPTAIDNCSSVTITSSEQTVNLTGCNKTITRTWVATDACGNSATYVQTINIVENIPENTGEDEEVPVLPVPCGTPYTPPVITNSTPLSAAVPGQTMEIAGFPMLLKNVSGSNGTFSGRGKVRLPFGNKVVYVDFSGINVNSDKKITLGSLSAVPDPNFVMPAAGSVQIGGEICLPEPPAIVNGFNEDGEYVQEPPYTNWQPGDPVDPNFDPNGFDVNGYNIETGTQFNQQGCNQQGLDADGNLCDPGTQGPYYWLHNSSNGQGETTPEGIAYALTLQTASPNIRSVVEAAITVLQGTNQTALTSQRTTCGTIRTDLNTKVNSTDRKYFFGENDIFFNEDMNLNFISKPIALQVNVPDRSPNIVDIESKHIELYYCDKLVYRLKQTALILADFKTETGLDILVPDVLAAIERLSKEQVAEFTADPTKLSEWIKTFVSDEVFKELQERGLVQVEGQSRPGYLCENTNTISSSSTDALRKNGAYLAAGTTDQELTRSLVAQSFNLGEDELKFEFLQGREYIDGVHRAFYLDAIAKARDQNEALTVEGEDPESLLPIRIEKEVGGRTYTMLLDKITLTPVGGTLDAYFILEIPSTGQKIVFKSTNVPFTAGGLAAANTKLSLQSDVAIRLNNAAKLTIKGGDSATFVEWGCDGFAGMGIKAEVEFCREYLLPLNPDLTVNPDLTKRVKATFTATMQGWGEFIATLSMDKFALAKHPDFKWEVEQASLDFSDIANPAGFTNISTNYFSEFGSGSSFSPQWKGFFMKRLKVTLPPQFTKSTTPVSITAENLIIDDRGLTGLVTVNAQIIALSNGNMDGWGFSMDQVTIAVVANKIQGGGFSGWLHVPLFSQPGNNTGQVTEQDCFRYDAKIISTDAGELYEFSVKPAADIKKMDILVGTATLKNTSSVKITYANDKFTILATLSGMVTIDGDVGTDTKFNVPDMKFENVKISNQAPYFRGGTFETPTEVGAKIGGFSINIMLPQLVNTTVENECTFRVGASIKLVGDGNGDSGSGMNFGAGTSVLIHGEMVTVGGRQRWKYKDYDVEQINVNASFKGVDALKGSIIWYKNDPVFGKGFRGRVAITFSGLNKSGSGGFGVEALAQFGKINDYKYFFVDALVSLSPGIDLGGLQIRGFGGGCYYHMDRDSNAFAGIDHAANAFALPNGLGVSLSGIKYTPSPAIGLGIKATIIVATSGNDQIFNGGATFEIRFNAPAYGGGIKDIALYGSARIMAPIQFGTSALFNSSPTAEAPVSASFAITYVFATRTLHGELAVFANVENAFTGAGPNNALGKAVLHFDPEKWYINIGTPSERLGVKVSIPIGSTTVELATVKAYFCVGTGIPAMPPLPAYVQQMTGASNFMANESRRASGRGFALGESIELHTPRLEFLIFYGKLDAGIGFDVMLQQYEGITCSNNNNKPLGINGWYASGQAWAYIDADLGVTYKNKEFPIMKIGAAAALQVKLPNPFWARGAVGGEYRILGGLVHGNCNFKFTLGKNCDDSSEESSAQYVKLIEDILPGDKAENVEVNIKPTVYFGVPAAGSFTVYADDGTEEVYTTVLEQIELKKADGTIVPMFTEAGSGNERSGSISVSDVDQHTRTFLLPNFLEGNTTYEFTVSIELRHDGDSIKAETKTVVFTTGPSPNVIPPSNVRSSYPQNGMYNLYKGETNKGYIELRDGQPEILTGANLAVGFVTKNQGLQALVPATAWPGGKMIEFELPAGLAPNQVYRMDLMLLAEEITLAGTGGSSSKFGNGGTAENPGGGPIVTNVDRSLYTVYFRTSTFNKFAEKLNYFKTNAVKSSLSGELLLTASMEPFDALELYGENNVQPLIPILHGDNSLISDIQKYYDALRFTRNFKPYGQGNLPSDYILCKVNGETVLPRVDIELYNSAAPGITNANVEIRNKLFSTTRSDFQGFASQLSYAIMDECNDIATAGNGNANLTVSCIPASFTVPNSPHCCESQIFLDILNEPGTNGTLLRQLYSLSGNIKPLANTEYSFYFGYHLPNGQKTTEGMPVYFKNFSNN